MNNLPQKYISYQGSQTQINASRDSKQYLAGRTEKLNQIKLKFRVF
jgi:hypothetical protein